jgi:hypothetical protein
LLTVCIIHRRRWDRVTLLIIHGWWVHWFALSIVELRRWAHRHRLSILIERWAHRLSILIERWAHRLSILIERWSLTLRILARLTLWGRHLPRLALRLRVLVCLILWKRNLIVLLRGRVLLRLALWWRHLS